jgi:hypothetical protein
VLCFSFNFLRFVGLMLPDFSGSHPKNRGRSQVVAKGQRFLLLIRHPPCSSYIQSSPVKSNVLLIVVCPFVLFLLVIRLSVLLFTASEWFLLIIRLSVEYRRVRELCHTHIYYSALCKKSLKNSIRSRK